MFCPTSESLAQPGCAGVGVGSSRDRLLFWGSPRTSSASGKPCCPSCPGPGGLWEGRRCAGLSNKGQRQKGLVSKAVSADKHLGGPGGKQGGRQGWGAASSSMVPTRGPLAASAGDGSRSALTFCPSPPPQRKRLASVPALVNASPPPQVNTPVGGRWGSHQAWLGAL